MGGGGRLSSIGARPSNPIAGRPGRPSHPIAGLPGRPGGPGRPGWGGGYPGYGGGYYPGVGWGLAAGAAAGWAYSGYCDPYYNSNCNSYSYYDQQPAYGQEVVTDDAVAYCAQRFKTYDVNTQTYIAKGGVRRSCP